METNQQRPSRPTREAGGRIKPRVSPRTRGDGQISEGKGFSATRFAGWVRGFVVVPGFADSPVALFCHPLRGFGSRTHPGLYSATRFAGWVRPLLGFDLHPLMSHRTLASIYPQIVIEANQRSHTAI